MKNLLWRLGIIFILNNTRLYSQDQNFRLVPNPSGFTPLSAIYRLDNTNRVPIVIIVQGKDEASSIGVNYPAGYSTDFPVYGLYEDHTNIITVKRGNISTTNLELVTPKVRIRDPRNPEFTTEVPIDRLPRSSIFDQELFFMSLPYNNEILGFDRKGDLRYVYQNPRMRPWLIRMENDDQRIYFNLINNNREYSKMDLLGKMYFKEKIAVHNEVIPYKDGQEFALGSSKWGWDDTIYILNKRKKITQRLGIGDAIRKLISGGDVILVEKLIYDYKTSFGIQKENKRRIDWAHANSIVYDTQNDLLYVSLSHLGLLAIRVDSWILEWYFVSDSLRAPVGVRYGQKPVDSLYLKDISSLSYYRMNIANDRQAPKGQYSLFLRKNGNIILFDSQFQGVSNPNGSRVIEYSFDHLNKKARVVKSFYDKDKTYSRRAGDVDLTGNNNQNTLVFFSDGRQEVEPEEDLTRPNEPSKNTRPKPKEITTIKKIIELNPQNTVIYQLNIDMVPTAYRIDKFPLYPYRDINKKYNLDYIEE